VTQWIYLALSRAQDETATDAAEPVADAEPKADDATNADSEAPADDKKSKGKGKSGGGVVDEILAFMKDTCDKIIKFISGKTDGGAVDGKTGSDDEAETTTEGAVVEDAKAKAGKKAKKVLDKIKKTTKDKDSDESEEWISFI